MLYGVDVHGTYQAGLDFNRLKAEGYSFCVTKATEGTGYVAPKFLEWTTAARDAGLIPGAYHWLKSGNATSQARFFFDRVKAAGGPAGLLIQLDCEDNATETDLKEWAAEWRRLSGNHPFLIYSGSWWWGPRGFNGNAITPYLWQSHYLDADADKVSDDVAAFAGRIPADWWRPGYGKWAVATILQFTSKGDAGSLGNNVDLNAYRGTLSDLRSLAGLEDTEDDVMNKDQDETQTAMAYRLAAIKDLKPVLDNHVNNKVEKNPLAVLLLEMSANLKSLAGKDFVDEKQIADLVLAGLGAKDMDEVASALRAVLTPEQTAQLAAELAG